MAGADNYTVYRHTSAITAGNLGSATVIADQIVPSTFTDAGRPEGTWWYAVVARNETGTSGPSNSESVTVSVGEPPGIPSLAPITPNPDPDGTVVLGWTDVPGATSYRVYRASFPVTSASGLTPVATPVSSTWVDAGRPSGTYYYAVAAVNASGASPLSNSAGVVVAIPAPGALLDALEASTLFDAGLELVPGVATRVRCRLVNGSAANEALLGQASVGVAPVTGHHLRAGLLFEITGARAVVAAQALPAHVVDWVDFFLSEDGTFRLLVTLNTVDLAGHGNETLRAVAFDLVGFVADLLGDAEASVPASWRWFYESPAVREVFHVTSGTNQYQLQLEGAGGPVEALLSTVLGVLDAFVTVDFYLLNARAGGTVRPLEISSRDLLAATTLFTDAVKLVTKAGTLVATGGTGAWLYPQVAASAFKLVYQLALDPPGFLDDLVHAALPAHYAAYHAVQEAVPAALEWVYFVASLVDPPAQRLDLGIVAANGTVLLGHDPRANATIHATDWGAYLGNTYLQVLAVNASRRPLLDLRLLHSAGSGDATAALNYSLAVKRVGANGTVRAAGALLPNASLVVPVNATGATLRVPHVRVSLVGDAPALQVNVTSGTGAALEVDAIRAFLGETPVACDWVHEGGGVYRLTRLDAAAVGVPVTFVFTKAGYLQQALPTTVASAPAPPATVPGYPGGPLLVLAVLGVALVATRAARHSRHWFTGGRGRPTRACARAGRTRAGPE